MNFKRVMSVALVSAMACGAVAGCSKGKARKIEGADDNACKLASVIEEIYDMKGIAVEETIKLDAKGDIEMNGNMSFKTIIDAKGNESITLNLDMKYQGQEIKGDVLAAYYVDNMMYLDFSPVYDLVAKAAGEEQVDGLTQMLNMTADELKGALCFNVPTGDLKASDYKLDAIKGFAQPIVDDIAIALTDAKAITADGDTYTVKLNGDIAKSFVSSFAKSFEANGSVIYDEAVKYIESLSMADKMVSVVNAILPEVSSGMKAIVGEEMDLSEMVKTDDIKTQVDDMIKDMKDKKDSYLSQIIDELKKADGLEAEGVQADDVNIVITDEKDGYTISLKGDSKTENMNGTVEMVTKVTSTSDTVKAPEKSTSLGDVISKVGGVVMMFVSQMGADF